MHAGFSPYFKGQQGRAVKLRIVHFIRGLLYFLAIPTMNLLHGSSYLNFKKNKLLDRQDN